MQPITATKYQARDGRINLCTYDAEITVWDLDGNSVILQGLSNSTLRDAIRTYVRGLRYGSDHNRDQSVEFIRELLRSCEYSMETLCPRVVEAQNEGGQDA